MAFWGLWGFDGGFRAATLDFMRNVDYILCPVCAHPALPHGDFQANIVKGVSHTCPYNLNGWPAVSVRAGASASGLPIGVQIVAQPGREDIALAVARHIESAFGGWKPPTAI